MANHVRSAPEWLSIEFLHKAIASSWKDPEFKVIKLDIVAGSSVGDNYVGQMFRLNLEYSDSNKANEKLQIIAKVDPKTKLNEKLSVSFDLFEREIYFYSYVLPTYKETMSQLKIETNFAPKCYFTDMKNGIILLEDLKVRNFELQEKAKLLNLSQAELVIDAIATMHATSYYLIKNQPDVKKTLDKHVFNNGDVDLLNGMIVNARKGFEKYINQYNVPDDWKQILTNLKEKSYEEICEIYFRDEEGINVLIHGDCWQNNLMFRFNPTNKNEAEEVILLDYQIITYTSFANDLQYFFFSSVEADIIIEKLDYLLERYFNKVSSIAPDFPGLSLDNIKEEFSRHYRFGFLIAYMLRPIVTSTQSPDLEKVLDGNEQNTLYGNPRYISDLQKLLPIFSKMGVNS